MLNTAAQSGSYTVTVTDGAAPNCTSAQSLAQVVTIQTPPATPTLSTSGNLVCAGTNVTLTSSAAPNGGTYTWCKNGTIDATLTTQSIVLNTAAQSGSYTVTVTDGAAPNCTSAQSLAQVVTIQTPPATPTLSTSGNSVCAGTNVTLTSSAAPNGGTYTWYKNGTIDATLTRPEHSAQHCCSKWKLHCNGYRWRCSELYECTKSCTSSNDSNPSGYTNTFNIRQPCLRRHECYVDFKRCSQWRNLHLV